MSHLYYLRARVLIKGRTLPLIDLGAQLADVTGIIGYNFNDYELLNLAPLNIVEAGGVAPSYALIADYFPPQKIEVGAKEGDVLLLSWGSTFGVVKTAVKEAHEMGMQVGHAHLRHIYPFPKNLKEILSSFKKVIIPEMNQGQLLKLIRSEFLIDAKGLNKVKGIPFTAAEILDTIKKEVEKNEV